MADRTIRLKSPKLGCIPIRRYLIFISFLGILGGPSLLITNDKQLTTTNIIGCAIGVAFNVCLFYGALKYNDRALGYFQKFLIFSMILSFLTFCFAPVFVTSLLSSDYYKYLKIDGSGNLLQISSDEERSFRKRQVDSFDENSFSQIVRKVTEQNNERVAAERFMTGLVTGEVVVFSIILYTLYIYMVYVMIKRLRKFIVARKEIDGSQTLA
ncbi:hypothetical protein L5515_009278 [Caenorhabditis briggsae]|uniref:Uncharacterized protein n=1 Tax=Caenorhabditis briggsae TaxID=6238 RepID=A0AAE9FB35_CAEBR|nr:hypothetical protein L5515_009278 [Caenorhabditis briggsae]